jgi:hypothetical protein
MAPQAGMQRRPSGRAGPVSTLLKGCSPPEQVTGPFAPARTGIIIHIGADRPRSGDSSSCSRGRFCRKGPCPNPAQKQVPPAPFHAISRVWGMPGSLSPKGEFTLVYPMLARLYPSAEMWPSGRRRSPAKGVGPKGSRGFESHRLRHLTPRISLFSLHRGGSGAMCGCLHGRSRPKGAVCPPRDASGRQLPARPQL